MTNTNPHLQTLATPVAEAIECAITSAYEQGYRAGNQAAIESILRAANQIAPHPDIAMATPTPEPAPAIKHGRQNGDHCNASVGRPFRYGAVSGAFREALKVAPTSGYLKGEFVDRAAEILGVSPSEVKYRDTFKRLREGDEMVYRNGRYFPGSGLAGARSENGAQSGETASAPDTGEVAPSPDENPQGFRLVG